ncbi:MAG: hypothetical protein HYU42_01105 [Candidatus Rokubacteria bacterium]|nr:hypothetical protein [Candidatus Rokubacteria bacterium]
MTGRGRPGTLVRAASGAESRAGQVWRWKKLLQPTASAERLRAVPPAPDLDAVPPAREPP